MCSSYGLISEKQNARDPFSIWFDEHFDIDVSEEKEKVSEYERRGKSKESSSAPGT
jgi:hypothetical protein